MSSDDIAVSVHNLTKTYRIFSHPGDRLKQAMTFGWRKYHQEYTALKNISLDIRKGETVGIIGRNGSGKSTLLQLICGILQPTSGTVEVNGRVSALLELGAGFNPEFTGRENVYFQGALMGLSKEEMDYRIDDITEFAAVGEFIDQPVRTYSSGMFVRLAFANMVHADADILVIDEALAVGDEPFQRKSFDKLADYLEGREKVLLLVSHNTRQIERVCSRSIWLQDGQVAEQGGSADVCDAYQAKFYEAISDAQNLHGPQPNVANSGEVDVLGITLLSDCEKGATSELGFHASARLVVSFYCHSILVAPEIVIGFHTSDSVFIAAASTASLSKSLTFQPGEHHIECRVSDMLLLPGAYYVRLGFFDRYRRDIWIGHRLIAFRVVAPIGSNVMQIPHGLVDMPFEWVLHPDETVSVV